MVGVLGKGIMYTICEMGGEVEGMLRDEGEWLLVGVGDGASLVAERGDWEIAARKC